MTTLLYHSFANLCESLIFETSTSLDLVKTHPGGQQVIQFLHTKKGLSHDQAYHPASKISWTELKDASRGAWVILKYPKGVGAIKQQQGSYTAVASSGAEPRVFTNDRGGNILDFLKGELGGNPKAMYIGNDTGAVARVQKDRVNIKRQPSANDVSKESLLMKFKPLWVKGATAAIADIKGMVSMMIKNDSFEKAERKLGMLRTLNNALDNLESGSENVPDVFRNALETAVAMAAHYYYPEETGTLSRGYRNSSYNPQYSEGVQKLLADIKNGEQKKLGTILSFFKRSLIS
jgi:hypothetical protein